MKKTVGIIIGLIIVLGGVFFFFNTTSHTIPFIGTQLVDTSSQEEGLELHPENIILADGTTFDLNVPKDFSISVAAEGFKRIRFMAESPDDRLFIADIYDLNDNTKGKIYILSDFDSGTHKYKKVSTYLSELHNPNSVAFYTDSSGQSWLYIALTDKLVRYKYTAGDMAPTSLPETLATFPSYGLNYKYGGWHLTRTIAIHKDKVYVSVGSSCNACEEKPDEIRASIVEMNADGSAQRLYATGLRNAVGIKWVDDTFFATEMGSDHLGVDLPVDKMYEIKEGKNYGWPYCYEENGMILPDTTQSWKKTFDCTTVPFSFAQFDAHSAPLGFEYFDSDAPKELRNSFLVALHGSGEVKINHGYSIVRVSPTGEVTDFITGFLQNGNRVARPVDILQKDESSFLFSDDFGGVLYYVGK